MTARTCTGSLCKAAVCVKHLRIDPSTIGSGEEGDDARDIVWLAEAFKWRHAADLFDLLFGLALQEEFGSDGSRRNGVDCNFVSAKLVGQNVDEAFDACLGGDVGAVSG